MPKQSLKVGAIIGSTLMALSLVGSHGNPANLSDHSWNSDPAEVGRLHDSGIAALNDGRYLDAHDAFEAAATVAIHAGARRQAVMNWTNAGLSDVRALQYRGAMEDYSRAKVLAEETGDPVLLIYLLNNIASLYLQMGAPEEALRISRETLVGPVGNADPAMHAKLVYQQAQALATLGRLAEAEPLFRQASGQLTALKDFDGASRIWVALGTYCFDEGRYADAESAVNKALELVQLHGLKPTAYTLSVRAKLRGKLGHPIEAELLFRQALNMGETVTPRWVVFLERGQFRLATGNNLGALEDFREARRLAVRMRIDVVPADRDRVAVENRLNRILEGLVDAGNRLASSHHDSAVLAETFDAAEEDRLWSLRALIPEVHDWRSRLPGRYWELLSRFQTVESSRMVKPSAALDGQAAELESELQQAETRAGAEPAVSTSGKQPYKLVRSVLTPGSVLFSFSITKNSSWLWAVGRQQISAYALPSGEELGRQVADFTNALSEGRDATAAGRRLYQSLFGAVPASVLACKRWFLEPDGPLYDLPFAALPVNAANRDGGPIYLIERSAVQSIPGALLLKQGMLRTEGTFVGVGDPIFNAADSRYRSVGTSEPPLMLPRLPSTMAEIDACARAWGSPSPRLLTGAASSVQAVEAEISASPAVIHFATHVVSAPGEFGSGLIALGFDARGVMGFLGPKNIAARRVDGSLVVMNGCHSARGETLPGSGLMGLTRAWIAAGASAVVSTRWDVPDATAQSIMSTFYRALHQAPRGSPALALREAQLAALHSDGPDRQPVRWAGYLLLSRI